MKQAYPWRRNTPEGRWYGFGRYYAMFPPRFAYDAISGLTRRGERVLDPFCGRGNGPFTATVLGRGSVGIDVNPLAWLFTAAKLKPAGADRVLDRLTSIGRAARARDRKGNSRFERMAWAPGVRSFLRAARRELDWQESRVDRTLMGFVTLHMQDKLGSGLSNRLWPTIACSPRYAVQWWTKAGLSKAPVVDPVAVLADKIRRRYECGRPSQAEGTALLGDARQELGDVEAMEASLLLTSPPYIGVTDYWNDHWIRLWMLGYPLRKDWRRSAKFGNQTSYAELLRSVFGEAERHLRASAPVLIRSDRRRRTASVCTDVLKQVWPGRRLYVRETIAPSEGVSVHHGRGGRKANELDLLLLGRRGRRWADRNGFQPMRAAAQA